MNNNLRQIRVLLYRLKRDFGQSITVVRYTQSALNTETGAVTNSRTEYPILRAIVGPVRALRDFVYDLSFVAANKNFTEGGIFQREDRMVIIEKKDMPTLVMEDKVVIGTLLYDTREFIEAEHGQAFLLLIRRVANHEAYEPLP